VPTESFFNFFDPPSPPQDEDDDASSDIEERLELDYQLGEDIKEKLIPRAIDWFTGEALQYENFEDFDEGEFEDEDDEDEDELSDDRDEDEESDDEVSFAFPRRNSDMLMISQNDGTKPKQEAAECKQS
jgi:nucleosome assembly protein 1-like 1